MTNRRREVLSVRSDVVNDDRVTPSQVLGVVLEKISGPYEAVGVKNSKLLWDVEDVQTACVFTADRRHSAMQNNCINMSPNTWEAEGDCEL